MNIVIKHVLKNIFAKPFRSLVLFVCIAICAFTTLLSLDILGSIELWVKSMGAQIVGTSDILFDAPSGITEELELDCENNQLLIYSREDGTVERIDGLYNYYHKSNFNIYYFDYDMAYKMALMPEKLELKPNEAAISKRLCEKNGWEKGMTVELVDDYGKPHTFTIVTELKEIGMANGMHALYVSKEGYDSLTNNHRANVGYIDVLNDMEAEKIFDELKDKYYNVSAQLIMDSEENKEVMKQLGIVMGLIFMVSFLLVVFVAISLSSRIICERMSVVGTLRSLGLSDRFTTKLLLFESGAYGLIGGGIGIGLYLLVRESIYGSIFSIETDNVSVNTNILPINPGIPVVTVMFCILIMCACPLKEILKTRKIAIRDIIFDNKDTAYKYSKKTFVIGCMVFVIAAVTFFLKKSAISQLVCFASIIVSGAMLFPFLLRVIGMLLGKLCGALHKPVAMLAANEVYARKSTVGSSVLCVTVSMLAIVIFIFVATASSIYHIDTYSCEVIVTLYSNQKLEQFSYVKDLDGVEDTEFIYTIYEQLAFDGKKREVNVFGLNEGGYRYLTGIKKCREHLENDEFLMDKSVAEKMNVEIGDTVEVIFGEDGFMPITKQLKLVGYIASFDYDSTSNSVVLSKDLYLDIYHDYPAYLLVKCTNEEQVMASMEKYSGVAIESVQTSDQILEEWQKKGDNMKAMLTMIIAMGIALSLIGMISNQLIGFEGRKREFAVLTSVAMTRGTVAKMLLLENVFATAASLIVAFPLALLSFVPCRRILEILSGAFKVTYDIKAYMTFFIILFVVFTLIVLFPIKELRKMKIADQLKYE